MEGHLQQVLLLGKYLFPDVLKKSSWQALQNDENWKSS
jgi:hypothetical protein